MNIASRFCHRSVISRSFLGFMQQRQTHLEKRASSDFALYTGLAAMGLDNPLDNRKTKSATAWPGAFRLTVSGGPLLPA